MRPHQIQVLAAATMIAALAASMPAASAAVRHHRGHADPRGGPGIPITRGASDVRINSVGEVIAPVVSAKLPEVK